MFLIFAQNIDCVYMLEPPHCGGPNEYPQSMFGNKIRKNMYTSANPIFRHIKVVLLGYSFHGHVLLMYKFKDKKASLLSI